MSRNIISRGFIRVTFAVRGQIKWFAAATLILLSASCMVGPNTQHITSPSFKEPPPDSYKEMTGWKVGQPRDNVTRGKWWEIFGDADLNALEEQIDVNSRTLLQAETSYRGARAAVRIARSGCSLHSPPGQWSRARKSSLLHSAASTGFKPSAFATAQIPFDGTWDADIWGRVRRTIEADIETAQSERERS